MRFSFRIEEIGSGEENGGKIQLELVECMPETDRCGFVTATTRRHFFTLKPRPFTPRTTRAPRTTRKVSRTIRPGTTKKLEEESATIEADTTTPELRLPTKPQTNPSGVTKKPEIVQATIGTGFNLYFSKNILSKILIYASLNSPIFKEIN